MPGVPCPDCGTLDERGPHTMQNCKDAIKDAIKYREVQVAERARIAEERAGAAEARVLELERRFHVVACPKCGSIGKRGVSHVHGFVTGSHVKYESCNGLEE